MSAKFRLVWEIFKNKEILPMFYGEKIMSKPSRLTKHGIIKDVYNFSKRSNL